MISSARCDVARRPCPPTCPLFLPTPLQPLATHGQGLSPQEAAHEAMQRLMTSTANAWTPVSLLRSPRMLLEALALDFDEEVRPVEWSTRPPPD